MFTLPDPVATAALSMLTTLRCTAITVMPSDSEKARGAEYGSKICHFSGCPGRRTGRRDMAPFDHPADTVPAVPVVAFSMACNTLIIGSTLARCRPCRA